MGRTDQGRLEFGALPEKSICGHTPLSITTCDNRSVSRLYGVYVLPFQYVFEGLLCNSSHLDLCITRCRASCCNVDCLRLLTLRMLANLSTLSPASGRPSLTELTREPHFSPRTSPTDLQLHASLLWAGCAASKLSHVLHGMKATRSKFSICFACATVT